MPLDLERLILQLRDCPIGHTIDYHQSIPSTMPVAHRLAEKAGTRSGTLVVAEEQSAGRGRYQRSWVAPGGQALLISVILNTPFGIEPVHLSMAVGVAMAQALEEFAPALVGRVGLKWPNDVLLDMASGRHRNETGKVAGILIETAYHGSDLAYAIAGIGINVNQTAAMLPARQAGAPAPVSLRLSLGQGQQGELDRSALLIVLCRSLGSLLAPGANPPNIFALWRSLLWTLGEQVNVIESGAVIYRGRAIDVAPNGNLLVEDDQGRQRYFVSGEVSLRTP